MYCSGCNCEFERWSGRCPQCKQPLLEVTPVGENSTPEILAYEDLLKKIAEAGGKLNISLSAAKVSKSKTKRFPWLGYGFAWTSKMQGADGGLSVEFNTTMVEKKQSRRFPYQGFGYAWRQEMQGLISGNQADLIAINVNRKKTWSFPYSGQGYAWTDEMRGKCGQDIDIELKSTKVIKIHRRSFPYFGFGYSWVSEGLLTLMLTE